MTDPTPSPRLSWPAVVLGLGLALMLLTSVTLLGLAGKDVNAIYGALGVLVVGVLGAFGWNIHNKLGEVKEMTNGRLSQVINDNMMMRSQWASERRDMQDKITTLALQIQPPEKTSDDSQDVQVPGPY